MNNEVPPAKAARESDECNVGARPPIVDKPTWEAELRSITESEKALTRKSDAVAAARRRLPMTPVRDAMLIGECGKVPFVEAFEGRDTLITYTFMWNHGRPFSEQCMGCTFSVSQLPSQTYLSQRGVTLAVLSEGTWEEISAYRRFMGWSHPWYSLTASLDCPEVAGEKYLRCYLRSETEAFLTYQTTDRGTEVMDPVLGLLDRTAFGRREVWEDSPAGWPQSPTGEWWLSGGRPAAQYERPFSPELAAECSPTAHGGNETTDDCEQGS